MGCHPNCGEEKNNRKVRHREGENKQTRISSFDLGSNYNNDNSK